MSRYDYEMSKQVGKGDPPFYAMIMACMRKADTDNLMKLRMAWPDVWDELEKRYWAPGGHLPGDGPE